MENGGAHSRALEILENTALKTFWCRLEHEKVTNCHIMMLRSTELIIVTVHLLQVVTVIHYLPVQVSTNSALRREPPPPQIGTSLVNKIGLLVFKHESVGNLATL